MLRITFILLLTFSCLLTLNAQEYKERRAAPPKDYTSVLDIVYTTVDGWNGEMDIYLPPKDTAPAPLVVHIHGGGFTHGDKESQWDFAPFFDMGFAVANVSYRLAEEAPAPAAIQDVRCAVAFLVHNAQILNIDTSKIVLRGSSAGGHLALMTGFLNSDTLFNCDKCAYDEVKVAAVIEISAPTDLNKWNDILKAAKLPKSWLNGNTDSSFVGQLSPVNYVCKDCPPVFIAHGKDDTIVPYEQAEILYKSLKDEGVDCKFIVIEDGEHTLNAEQRYKVNSAMRKFIKKTLDL